MKLKTRKFSDRISLLFATCGCEIPEMEMSIICGSFGAWKEEGIMTLKQYDWHVFSLKKENRLSESEKKRCGKICSILKFRLKEKKEKLEKMEETVKDWEAFLRNKDGDDYRRMKNEYFEVLGLKRAIETLEDDKFDRFSERKVKERECEDAKNFSNFLKEIGKNGTGV